MVSSYSKWPHSSEYCIHIVLLISLLSLVGLVLLVILMMCVCVCKRVCVCVSVCARTHPSECLCTCGKYSNQAPPFALFP